MSMRRVRGGLEHGKSLARRASSTKKKKPKKKPATRKAAY